MRLGGPRRRRASVASVLLIGCAICAGIGIFTLAVRSLDPSPEIAEAVHPDLLLKDASSQSSGGEEVDSGGGERRKSCATVEEMGEVFRDGFFTESLRVRELIRAHFDLNGAARVRGLPPEQFCKRGFVLGKASEAGFGNEMYKVLTGAALSVMLNRGKFPFGDYISYSDVAFTLKEVKHLWRHNGCRKKYGRQLVMRIDDFVKPLKTDVLCSNWKEWKQPIVWLQNTTDAVAAQFFLKNKHSDMRNAASTLFGHPESLHLRPNVYGELMRILISPSQEVDDAVNWVLRNSEDPDISLHMRMMNNRSPRAAQAAINCIRKATSNLQLSKPRVVIVSDTPTFVKGIISKTSEFAEILHFDHKVFRGNISLSADKLHSLEFRSKDWGPAPRWVAFVDFFLASRAKHVVVSGAHRRVGTTYAQLIAALAAANNMGDGSGGLNFSFLSSFQSNLLAGGLGNQIGWGHVWNRFAGPLSCRGQPNQCALTPFLPPAWWDGLWQSPIPRDVKRLAMYGIKLSGFGTIDEDHLLSFCNSKKKTVRTVPIISD
ncbi:hypothetical protein CDL15_Pgr005598 [Punica granatum]|uniref:Uncharacterized protein n=1 Tax=Punica granatum TaxID=22663 RepID=A0A218WGQ7_PUNGR|nr:hypothetical protein CDL15_Pgr005598 [Punica granatum]